MARNYEKNFGQLNRWWMAENAPKKPPKRPRLADLNTVADIRKWLPVVKEEMNFCLMQSQVPCYTDKKVSEYHKQVLKLEIEYKRMLKKAKSLDSMAVLRDQEVRPYKRKRKEDEEGGTSVDHIVLPVLDLPENQPEASPSMETVAESSMPNDNLPLKFERSLAPVKPLNGSNVNVLGLSYSSSDDDT